MNINKNKHENQGGPIEERTWDGQEGNKGRCEGETPEEGVGKSTRGKDNLIVVDRNGTQLNPHLGGILDVFNWGNGCCEVGSADHDDVWEACFCQGQTKPICRNTHESIFKITTEYDGFLAERFTRLETLTITLDIVFPMIGKGFDRLQEGLRELTLMGEDTGHDPGDMIAKTSVTLVRRNLDNKQMKCKHQNK